MNKCSGLLGRIFGHKFRIDWAGWSKPIDYCSRCGMPAGGWRDKSKKAGDPAEKV